MILKELCDYYDVLAGDREINISTYGYEEVSATYEAVLSIDGELVGMQSLVNQATKKRKTFIMPKGMKKSGIASSPVCDNIAYIFGISGKKGEKKIDAEKFQVAKKLHLELFEHDDSPEAKAIVSFFNKWEINKAWDNEHLLQHYNEKGEAFTGNVVFKLLGETRYFHETDEIKNIWLQKNSETAQKDDKVVRQCSITGKISPITQLHEQFSGVKGASTMGASLVCFNKDSDLSYNLKQSFNAAVSEEAMFKYSTALKYMLASSKQKLCIGDDTAVFWASSTNTIYTDLILSIFNITDNEDNDEEKNDLLSRDRQTEETIKKVLENGAEGLAFVPDIDPEVNFCILGLAPNAGRISVRYFYCDTFSVFCDRIKAHYDDIQIVGDKHHINIYSLIYATISSNSKDKKANPLLGGAVSRAILTGGLYPRLLFSQTILRTKTETSVSQARAAIIKGFLTRQNRLLKQNKEEVSVSLNMQSTNSAYILGRVFSILEMIQKRALGKVNATIKDKYFASACSNPSLVFPNLLKLAQHHLAKLEGPYYDNLLCETLARLESESFPKVLGMEDQGRFILGYYQQAQKFYEKKNKQNEGED